MKNIIRTIILSISLFFFFSTIAQEKKEIIISGFVKGPKDKPITDCSIFVDKKKQKLKTNHKGFYSLKLKTSPKELLFFSPQNGVITITNLNYRYLNISFKKEGASFNQSYTKEFSTEENENRHRYTDIYDYLRGKVPGVQVASDDTILIRGASSLYGSNTPLFILNDVAINIDDVESINPNDIKTVKVVKGSEATRYGVRGSTGVIIIETL